MPDIYHAETIEDSPVERMNRRIRMQRIVMVGVMLILTGSVIWFYLTASVASQKALREAKDVRLAMRMIAIEKYSEGTSIYNPLAKDGLVPGVAEKVAKISGAEGRIILTGWDTVNNDANSFTYTKGNYVVFFNKSAALDPEGLIENDVQLEYSADMEKSQWEVYLQIRVTDFE
ncbi:MAG: hypothetical protein K5739_09645 [Lachnospiraceae bacterium]|nr:hypothetical protein [Lachnospiraceae bacterium]